MNKGIDEAVLTPPTTTSTNYVWDSEDNIPMKGIMFQTLLNSTREIYLNKTGDKKFKNAITEGAAYQKLSDVVEMILAEAIKSGAIRPQTEAQTQE